jgi:hypothetical protein
MVAPARLLCTPHWQAVPLELRRAVNRTWAALQLSAGPLFAADRDAVEAAYEAAREAALASLGASE